MKTIYLFLLVPLALINYNCSGSKKSTNNSNTVKTENSAQSENTTKTSSTEGNNNKSTTPQIEDKKLFRFTVSFISKGAGTDYQIRQKYDAFVNDFENQNKVKVNINKASWGREGEMDYCIEFGDIKKEIIEKFISESKALLNLSDRINIGENTHCRGIIK
jgi:hypothetical protein